MRHQRQYTNDSPNQEVFPLNCVPEIRSKGAWTQGIKAWTKGEGGLNDSVAGWFHPPRTRNKGHKNHYVRIESVSQIDEEE
jgi:hypothetical protein|tara:strand:- start:414 stop:656 length:243 start_codon:yes stop_codon:yes gene_type:complete